MVPMAIWQGFNYEWRHYAHRLNRFGSFLEDFDLAADGRLAGYYVTRLRVGAIQDAADATTMVLGVHSTVLHYLHGFVTYQLVGKVGSPQVQEKNELAIPLPAFPGESLIATPLLRGFDLRCTSFEQGLHTQGFGFELTRPYVRANHLYFTPRLSIFPNTSPDPLTRTPETYSYVMTIFYTVIYAVAGQAHFTLGSSVAPTVMIRHTGPRLYQEGPAQAHLSGQGGGFFNQGFVGVRGFRWELLPWRQTRHDGRYLRSLRCFVAEPSYDPLSGRATFLAHMWFSNHGGMAYGFDAVHELFATLVQFSDDQASLFRDSLYNGLQGAEEVWQAFRV